MLDAIKSVLGDFLFPIFKTWLRIEVFVNVFAFAHRNIEP